MRRNCGDAAAHHSTHNTQDHTHIYIPRASRSMEEGGDGVVRGACVQDDQIFEIWYYHLPT